MSKKQRRMERARQQKWSPPRIDLGTNERMTVTIIQDTVVRDPDAPAEGGHGEVEVPVVAAKPPSIGWDDVIGQEEAKAALIDAIETPIVHCDLFAAYGQKHSKGVLLYGPPGVREDLAGQGCRRLIFDAATEDKSKARIVHVSRSFVDDDST